MIRSFYLVETRDAAAEPRQFQFEKFVFYSCQLGKMYALFIRPSSGGIYDK